MTTTQETARRALRVAVHDEPELVHAGVERMLGDSARLQTPGSDLSDADVLLCDPAGRPVAAEEYLASVIAQSPVPVVVFSWQDGPQAVRRARAAGAAAYLSKAATAAELLATLEAVHRGEQVGLVSPDEPFSPLSAREAEVLALICRGRSNLEIAGELYVSVNSVKTYIRQIYQKIGVSRRAQAVGWGLARGY